MARPRLHDNPVHRLFELFSVRELAKFSNNFYTESYLESISSGRQPATRRFRRYWTEKLGRSEESLFGGTHDK